MKDESELMEELGDALCRYCPWTEYGEISSMIHTPNGVIMCEGSHCKVALDNYLESNEVEVEEESDWRECYRKYIEGGRK